jgi:phosphoribosylanthranilate isomerase
MTLVKICGLKTVDTAKALVPLAADYVGFVFAPSRRRVTAAEAGAMIRAMRELGQELNVPAPLAAGVFVDPSAEEAVRIAEEASLDVVQLHGSETPDFCRRIRSACGVKVWRVFSAAANGSPEQCAAPYADAIDAILLDTAGGGTGQTFDWGLIPEWQRWASEHSIPLIIAGGLNPDNVGRLLSDFRPDGVDVSSGVETDGAKDIDKIRAFIERVRLHDAQANAG